MIGFCILLMICISIGTGIATAFLGKNKGYKEEVGANSFFWAGLFFGIYALIYTAGLPISEKMREEERSKLIQGMETTRVVKKPVVIETKTVIADDLPQW